jgi:hypothetical protein
MKRTKRQFDFKTMNLLYVFYYLLLQCMTEMNSNKFHFCSVKVSTLPKGYHLDVVGGPNTPQDPESDAGGSLSSWQGHPSR